MATLNHYHVDPLNAPRFGTDSNGTLVWWAPVDADPFFVAGGSAPGLRFPGQYYLPETGLYYNYFRDYDPYTGRYLQSDPIGLEGGVNLYVYAYDNPLRFIDPFGLAPPTIPGVPATAVVSAVTRNTIQASTMGLDGYRDAVTNDGSWDYKKLIPNSENLGNYNFGATCAAAGFFSLETCLREAGKRQCVNGNSKPEWGNPRDGPPYGDDPNDQKWIRKGWNDYKSGIYGGDRSSPLHRAMQPLTDFYSRHSGP